MHAVDRMRSTNTHGQELGFLKSMTHCTVPAAFRGGERGGSDGGVGPRRTCRHANEGGDSPDWTDAYGHDCAWYYDNRRSFAGICGPRLVRQFCPEACGVSKPCFEVRSV